MANLSSYNFIFENVGATVTRRITLNINDYNSSFIDDLQSKINSNKTDNSRDDLAALVLADYYREFISSFKTTDPVVEFVSPIESYNVIMNKFQFYLAKIISEKTSNVSLNQLNKLKSDINFFNNFFIREVYQAESSTIEDFIRRAQLDLNVQQLFNSQTNALINSNLLPENKLNITCESPNLKRIVEEKYKWFNN
jgi:hypothetical protein